FGSAVRGPELEVGAPGARSRREEHQAPLRNRPGGGTLGGDAVQPEAQLLGHGERSGHGSVAAPEPAVFESRILRAGEEEERAEAVREPDGREALRSDGAPRIDRESPFPGAVAAPEPRDELGWIRARGGDGGEVDQGAGRGPGRHAMAGLELLQRADRTLGRSRGGEQAETDGDQTQEESRFCFHAQVYAGP